MSGGGIYLGRHLFLIACINFFFKDCNEKETKEKVVYLFLNNFYEKLSEWF